MTEATVSKLFVKADADIQIGEKQDTTDPLMLKPIDLMGKSRLVLDRVGTGTWTSDILVDRGTYTAVLVETTPYGAGASATLTVLDAYEPVATAFGSVVDPAGNPSGPFVATDRRVILSVQRYLKARLVVTAGNWSVRITPIYGQPLPQEPSEIDGSFTAITDTVAHTVIPAKAGLQIFLTQIIVSNPGTVAVVVQITGLASGNTYYLPAPNAGGSIVNLPTPLPFAVGTAVTATCSAAPSTPGVNVSAVGFTQ